jgi:hypothetical protein
MVKLRMCGAIPPLPQYAFMAWYPVKKRHLIWQFIIIIIVVVLLFIYLFIYFVYSAIYLLLIFHLYLTKLIQNLSICDVSTYIMESILACIVNIRAKENIMIKFVSLQEKYSFPLCFSFSVWSIQPNNSGSLLFLWILHHYILTYMWAVFRKKISALRVKHPLKTVEHKESILL